MERTFDKANLMARVEELSKKWEQLGGKLDMHTAAFIDDEHLDSLWFGGYIGTITYGNVTIDVKAVGDVRATLYRNGEEEKFVKDKSNNGIFAEKMVDLIDNDTELSCLLAEAGEGAPDRLELVDGNWFEYFINVSGEPIGDVDALCCDALEAFEPEQVFEYFDAYGIVAILNE